MSIHFRERGMGGCRTEDQSPWSPEEVEVKVQSNLQAG